MSSGHNVTFSGSLLRERDKKLLEKHAKEKAELEFRIQKQKRISDERAKELFDALHRGDRLARSIGFEDLYEAQIYLDSFDHSTTFKECIDRTKSLETELKCEKKEVEILQFKLNKAGNTSELQDELEKLKTELSNSERRYQEELKNLQDRYDSLKVAKERAAERYKADFKKWRQFCRWLFAENDDHHKYRNEPGISKEEKKRRDLESVMKKRKKMIEIGPDLAQFEGEPKDSEGWTGFCHPPSIGCIEMDLEADKENDGSSSTPSEKKPRQTISDKSANSTSTLRPLQDIQLNKSSVTNLRNSSSSVASPSTCRILLPSQPKFKREELDTTPTNIRSRTIKRVHMPSSSDTEEDSQAVAVPSTNPRSGKISVFKVPAAPASSSNRPSEALKSLDLSGTKCMGGDIERPSKVRRLSDESNVFACLQDDNQATPCPPTKGKTMDFKVTTASLNSGENSKRPDDYSAYKGRGRYSGQIQNSEKTINALYTIDPKSNGGKDYQFDEVVRNKDERRKMHAGDCECCREYYKNVGPLPNRLQQPLWRSPSQTPSRSHALDSPRRQADIDIEAHRRAISRHKHMWARAKTPPGYWEIGFPNTQEVGDINMRAVEMQKMMMTEVDRESRRDGGRYKKK